MSKIALISFSHSGSSARLARVATSLLEESSHEASSHSVVQRFVRPKFRLPSLFWLLLSCYPRMRVPIEPLLFKGEGFDGALIVMPKWAHSCPPMEEFFRLYGEDLPPSALIVSCGGWDQERFLERYKGRIIKAGAACLGGEWFLRRQVGKPHTRLLMAGFLSKWFGAA
jgi:hypothetical protein